MDTPPNWFRKFEAPLIHKICELYKLFSVCLKTFPNQERYSLGKKIEETILEILEFSLKATYSSKHEKLPFLKEIDYRTKFLKILIRMANEVKVLNDKKYLLLQENLQEIGRMTGGWIKYLI